MITSWNTKTNYLHENTFYYVNVKYIKYIMERMMLKLKLQYFGHLMGRVDSLEKTLMLGEIGGRRRRGRQRMRWLDGITDLMDVSFEWTPGVGDGQGGRACCNSCGRKESDMTDRLNWLNEWMTRKWNRSVVSNSLWLYDSRDCCLPGSSVHGILQARVLEGVAISFSRGSSRPRDRTQVSCLPGRCFNLWASR